MHPSLLLFVQIVMQVIKSDTDLASDLLLGIDYGIDPSLVKTNEPPTQYTYIVDAPAPPVLPPPANAKEANAQAATMQAALAAQAAGLVKPGQELVENALVLWQELDCVAVSGLLVPQDIASWRYLRKVCIVAEVTRDFCRFAFLLIVFIL